MFQLIISRSAWYNHQGLDFVSINQVVIKYGSQQIQDSCTVMTWHRLYFNIYKLCWIGLVPAQDGPFFYTRSHLSALQNCALLFSANLQFIFILKKCKTQFSHWIVSCTIFFKSIVQVFIKFTHSFVAIELLTFCKNAKKLFYCSRELSLFWLNKQYSICR